MASRVLQRWTRAALAIAGVSALAGTAFAETVVRRVRRVPAVRGFNLFAGASNVVMNVNRVQCNINTIGESCVDPTNSPVLGGGFWPKGSPNQYIFNSGLQIAAIIPGADQANFPWPGDTVGAFFFDPRGDQAHGEGRTSVFNALVQDDLDNWPTAGMINDTSLFHSSLIGRKTVSQQDTWVRFWDGNTQLTTGRQHPMGLLVEQRGLAWNFPAGNQDIVYFLYRFINISAREAGRYAGLSQYGYSATDIAEIAAIGADFQDRAEAAYNVQIPDSGYQFTNVFAAFAQDPDVGQAGSNYSTAILPFAIALAYKSDFLEPLWSFPPDINGAPFAPAPGFEGVKYLGSPGNAGISMFGNTTNGAPFPDRVGVQALWRGLSGNLLPQDGACNVSGVPQQRRICYQSQTAVDTRFFESSGPFTLNPGEAAVIVVAYVHAAPVASAVAPFIGGNMGPGFPIEGSRLVLGTDTLRNVDRAAGWVSHADADGDLSIQQDEVVTVPRSLLNKSLVAQAVFDNRFLLPFAPEVPEFYLVPGENQVIVAWERTSTEAIGDPFFAVASDVTSPLYDQNFREFDVEGYRIWRGRNEAQMEVIASFDYSGTSIIDYTGQFFDASYGNECAPELGVTASCPAFPNPVPLAGAFVQVPPGGRVELANGTIFNVVTDTAITGGNSGLPGLIDNGVPFVYVDNAVRSGFRYFYAVTAFDVNSVKSGPSSLESPLVTKTVIPRAPASNPLTQPAWVQRVFGGDGTPLDPSLPFPAVDAANGTLAGPIPPANAALLDLTSIVAAALPAGDYAAQIDSVSPGFTGGFGAHPLVYLSFLGATDTTRLALDINPPNFNAAVSTVGNFSGAGPLVPYDATGAATLGIPASFQGLMPALFTSKSIALGASGAAIALANGRYGAAGTTAAARFLSHSYWYNEGGSPPADPTMNPFPHASNNSGALSGVTRIWTPKAYRVPLSGTGGISVNFRGFSGATAGAWYPADIVLTWGAGGTVTVRDSTHRTNLPFMAGVQPGYGFLDLASLVAAGVTASGGPGATSVADGQGAPSMSALAYHHLYAVNPVCTPDWWDIPTVCTPLVPTASLQPLDFDGNGTTDGNGIVMLINGEAYFMEMAALPAAGTQWHLTAWGGGNLAATCTPAFPTTAATTDCSGYSYTPPAVRPAYAPGMRVGVTVTQTFARAAESGNLDRIHTVPDPYYVTNALEITANTKVLRFVNLPDRAIIRIYSTSGILVNVLSHNSVSGGGEATWNLRNRNNQFVASGVYFYHVETPDGREKIGRFTVVNFAQ